jgi:hypothetical protein
LFALVTDHIHVKDGVQVPRSINDYVLPTLTEIEKHVPDGVKVHTMAELAKRAKTAGA